MRGSQSPDTARITSWQNTASATSACSHRPSAWMAGMWHTSQTGCGVSGTGGLPSCGQRPADLPHQLVLFYGSRKGDAVAVLHRGVLGGPVCRVAHAVHEVFGAG